MRISRYLLVGLLFLGGFPSKALDTDSQPENGGNLRWLGYSVFNKRAAIAEIASYTNFVWFRKWTGYEALDRLADAARKSGLKVVLEIPRTQGGQMVLNATSLTSKVVSEPPRAYGSQTDSIFFTPRAILEIPRTQGWEDIKDVATPFIEKNRDIIMAICWSEPSFFNGWTREQLAADARQMKNVFPELQCWVECDEKLRGKLDTETVPQEMDVIVVNSYFGTQPGQIRKNADETLPGWIEKANGRPVLLQWLNRDKGSGLVPKTMPSTMRMCAEIAKKYHLAGLAFYYYGNAPDQTEGNLGIETNPALVKEIKAIAKECALTLDIDPASIQTAAPVGSQQGPSPADRIKQIKQLMEQGLIDKQEYDRRVKEILDAI